MDANFGIRPIDCQLELDQGVTDFNIDANFAIGPIGWQLDFDQGVTESYMDANLAIGPINWQLRASLSFTWMPTLPSDQSTGNQN